MDAKPNDIIPSDSSGEGARSVRGIYARRMSKERIAEVEADLKNEDRYDMSTEQVMMREFVASLVEMEEKVLEKHPGRDDLLVAIREQKAKAIQDMAKTNEHIRRVETAGEIFTKDKIASLIDKIASLVVYHVTDLTQRQRVLSDMNDLAMAFRRAAAQGTLLTPDQDAVMMDATVPAPTLESPEFVGAPEDTSLHGLPPDSDDEEDECLPLN